MCKKTAETPEQMAQTWATMAAEITLQPVPDDMARVVDIICNDCEKKSVNKRWHILGVQCGHCPSFNTIVERTVFVGQEAADFLGPPPQISEQMRQAVSADSNVFPALIGGSLQGAEEMDTVDMDELHQRVTAEVHGIIQNSSSSLDTNHLTEHNQNEE